MKAIFYNGVRLFLVGALWLGSVPVAISAPLASHSLNAYAQDPAPDNTKTNQRDRRKDEPTADQQKNNKSDLELAQKIRQAVHKDKSLSTAAHNVKIISQGGTVTLKGPVRSEQEKQKVEATAKEIAGDTKVVSELQVAPKNHKKKKA